MTGPEHYREAERLLESVTDTTVGAVQGMATIAAAQVHATLALAVAAEGTLRSVGESLDRAASKAVRRS